ncbi:MAG TPA: TetR/AcrR family transcriptional regulator [Acidimicrobiales bacterium]|nr:TetR/AcrR family transcriptional regulator [Acidimicrobiales bacterium]
MNGNLNSDSRIDQLPISLPPDSVTSLVAASQETPGGPESDIGSNEAAMPSPARRSDKQSSSEPDFLAQRDRGTSRRSAHSRDSDSSRERTHRRALRRESYLEATATAIRTRGPAISMEDIASACGVTKPILYRHFADRNGLVRALADKFAGQMFVDLDLALNSSLDPRRLLSSTIDTYLRLLEKEPEIYQFVTQRAVDHQGAESPTMIGDFQREVGRRVALVMGEKMREAGMDSGGVEPIAHGIVGLVHSAGDWWIERRSMPRHRLVAYLSDLIWGGLTGMAMPADGSHSAAAPLAADEEVS